MGQTRERLPNRRECEGFDIEALGLRFHATVGRFADGRLAEVFITNHKAGSMAGILASDSAVLCSIAMQYGAPVDVIRKALMRDPQGRRLLRWGACSTSLQRKLTDDRHRRR